MSAIAYITDSKMLELHRLNSHKAMNFWRLSKNISFTDFGTGDLVFFLSKDREHKSRNEKGIVGFGRLNTMSVSSIQTMWNKYGILNGYQSLKEFKEAIIRVSKDKQLPKKISGFYLENVVFFPPVYLSECGMKISNSVESYIYLKKEEVVLKLLDLAKQSDDLWSRLNNNFADIEKEEIIYALFSAHNRIKDIEMPEPVMKKATKTLRQYIKQHPEYQFIQNSRNEIYKITDQEISFIFYYDKQVDQRLLIGQAYLYKYYLNKFSQIKIVSNYRFVNRNEKLSDYLNTI